LETPWAIARAVLDRRPFSGRATAMTDVYAYAKRDVKAGETVSHGIGGDSFYGLWSFRADRPEGPGADIAPGRRGRQAPRRHETWQRTSRSVMTT
jgi:hypothetical protein